MGRTGDKVTGSLLHNTVGGGLAQELEERRRLLPQAPSVSMMNGQKIAPRSSAKLLYSVSFAFSIVVAAASAVVDVRDGAHGW